MTASGDGAGSALRLEISSDRCAGHGRCFALSPKLLDCDDSGYAVVLIELVPSELVDSASDAVANCPEGAISLRPAPKV